MAKKTTDFGKAYRKARNAGKKTFTWKGKSYTTESREEKKTRTSSKSPDTVVSEDYTTRIRNMSAAELEKENQKQISRRKKSEKKSKCFRFFHQKSLSSESQFQKL